MPARWNPDVDAFVTAALQLDTTHPGAPARVRLTIDSVAVTAGAVLRIHPDLRGPLAALAAEHHLLIDSVNRDSCYVHVPGDAADSGVIDMVEVVGTAIPSVDVARAWASLLTGMDDELRQRDRSASAPPGPVVRAAEQDAGTPAPDVYSTGLGVLVAQLASLASGLVLSGPFGSSVPAPEPRAEVLAQLITDLLPADGVSLSWLVEPKSALDFLVDVAPLLDVARALDT